VGHFKKGARARVPQTTELSFGKGMYYETYTVPKELLWGYVEPPNYFLWRLQRAADFFPAYGTDRETV